MCMIGGRLMYQELKRKVIEEKPSYSQKELQWLLEHLGDSSPEIPR